MENILSKMIERQRSGEIQYIDFSQLTNLAWDQLYVVGPYTNLDRLPLINDWPHSFSTRIEYDDGIVLFIFVKEGKAVQYLEYGRGTCDFDSSARMWSYSRNETLFVVNDKNKCIPIQ